MTLQRQTLAYATQGLVAARFVLIAGEPIGEPVVQHGTTPPT